MTETTVSLTTFAQAEARLAASLPGYESRVPQQRLAEAIEDTIASRRTLIAEAGTGVGKSFATAIPAILSGQRVVMSTATKALQDQIAEKDLPFLAEHLGVPFTFALLKGRSNYLCRSAVLNHESQDVPNLAAILKRSEEPDFDGTEPSLGIPIERSDWVKLTVSSEECPGKKNCQWGATCFAEAAKAKAQESDVVIVNHALLMTELVIRRNTGGAASMLGPVDMVIIDEAHELEDYAVGALTSQITEGGIGSLCTEITNFTMRTNSSGDELTEALANLRAATLKLWTASRIGDDGKTVKAIQDGRLYPSSILAFADEWVELANAAYDLLEAFGGRSYFSEIDQNRYTALRTRVRKLSVALVEMVSSPGDQLVRWVETETTRRGVERAVIKSAPIEIGDILYGLLFAETPAVLVSATMSVDGSMGYIAGRLGVDLLTDGYDSLLVGTPFNYGTQSRLYVPRHLPAPAGNTRDAWESMVLGEMLELIRASEGRALLLFTSVAQMKAAREMIEPLIPYRVLMQGERPNPELAADFRSDTHSVLFGTKSFFTGMDFQGSTLSLVVIDKLPFPVPTEPMTEARCELIKARGGNDFSDYTIPVMSLVLAQGFGRLIRTSTDRGVVAILDPRLVTKGYGSKIRRSLPAAPLVESVQAVQEFFSAA